MNHNRNNFKQVLANCRYLVLLIMLLLPFSAFAQSLIHGTVTDRNTGEAIIGATVKVKGGGAGAVTDLDGAFSISASRGQTIEISYVGYATLTTKVTGSSLDIKMSEDAQTLNDVVVVGYGVMKRSDLTGSVSSINEEQIKKGVNTSLEQAMQGRIAGVQVMQNSGAPGGGISVQIRGINTFSGNEPLYVIDGIAQSGNNENGSSSVMASINPSDITSIEVLKDASATAIYGSRASNGVVMITTKRGQEGKAKIQYEGYVGWQQMPKKLDVMSLPQYATFYNERARIQGWGEREDYKHTELLTDGTNWQDELFQTAFMHNHSVNINGGTKDMHYSISGGFLDQDGTVLGSGFSRASIRTNFDTNITKWLQVGTNIYYANTKQLNTFSSGSVIKTALDQYPDVAPRNPDGSYAMPETNSMSTYYTNPIFEANVRENKDNNYTLDYNAFASLSPVKGLNIRVEYGGNRGWTNNYYYQPSYTYGTTVVRSEGSRTKNLSKYTSFKQYATYDIDPFKNHHLQIMAGHEAQWGNWETLSGTRYDYISNSLHSLNVGDASTAKNTGDDGTKWGIESYYGRLNYNFMDRYLFTATLRADGSTSFSSVNNNNWGYFPSVAAAWRVNNEKFLKDVKWLNNLKLRLGWGLVGNQSSASYAYGAKMANSATAWGTGYYPGNFSNYNLKWETTKAWNIGLDLNLLDNRIEFIVDAYLKKTDNLLMKASLPTYIIKGDYLGMEAPWVNTGSIENKGIEFSLNTVNIMNKDWQWRTGATLSVNRNKLLKLNSEDATITGVVDSDTYTLSEVGGPVGRFYGYNVIGMFTDEDSFYQRNSQGEFLLDKNGNKVPVARPADSSTGKMYDIAANGVWVGDYIFEDVNKDGIITEADRKYIGDPNPNFTFGLNNTVTWKDFELSVFINGSVGGDVYNLVRQEHTNTQRYSNLMAYVANYAQIGLKDANGSATDISNVYVTNPTTAQVQRISSAGSSMNDNNRISNRFVEDGSYLRLKTISLAWNLPKKWLSPLQLDWVQVYGNIQNLFTICGYDGYDPEVGAIGQSVLLQGIDNYRYPSQRIYTVGLKVKF